MENYDKNQESSHIKYLDGNNLHGWAMSQKFSVDGFKWKKYAKILWRLFEKLWWRHDEEYTFEVDANYHERLQNL